MDFVPMLLTGLVTSVHCVAMCGTLVLTYAIKGTPEGSWARRVLPHLAYHSAKITSYVIVGLLLGFIGSALDLGGIRGWVSVAAGVFMVLLGISMTGRFPRLQSLMHFRPPQGLTKAIAGTRRKAAAEAEETGEVSLSTPVTFGFLTGLMPCGPLQAAQLYAAGTGAPLSGAIAMLGFGLGTMPLMFGFGVFAGLLGDVFKKRMFAVASVIVIVLGAVMANRGLMLVGSPFTFQSMRAAVVGNSTVKEVKGDEVTIVIDKTRYKPDAIRVEPNKPIRLVIDRRENVFCSAQIAIPKLGILRSLTPNGKTVVELPALEAGDYTITCGMGMMSGRLSAGGATIAGRDVKQLVAIFVLLTLGVLLGYKVFRNDGERAAAVTPEGVTILGYTVGEVLAFVVGIVLAVLAALLSGGGLRIGF